MIIEIKVEKLKIGMFVDLSGIWIGHPFWKDRFEITSEKQIKKIVNTGIKSVKVDTDRSKTQINRNPEKTARLIEEEKKKIESHKSAKDKIGLSNIGQEKKDNNIGAARFPEDPILNDSKEQQEEYDNKDSQPHSEWQPEKFMPQEIVDKFRNKNLEPKDRAKAVHTYSVAMMKNLLENPTAEVIGASKAGISEIVEVILHENEISNHLMKVVSYDFCTYTHSVNVGIKAVILEKRFSKDLSNHSMTKVGVGFFLHDLGKVNIDQSIINKPGRFTEEEMDIMRTHPEEGYKILNEAKQLTKESWTIIMQHHERDDGSGYPRKLTGSQIHPHARICTIVDVYDALTGKRSYKEAKKPVEALKIMYKEMANHFNEQLLKDFISLFRDK